MRRIIAATAMSAGLRRGVKIALVLLLVWQGAIWLFDPPRYVLPGPWDVGTAFLRQPLFFARHSLTTATEILLGFVLGAGAGAGIALLMAAFPRLGRNLWPLLLVMQALPVFVIAPLLVVWFGFGMGSKVIMAMIIIFFPVASAFADGLRRTDPDLVDATAMTEATHWQSLIHVRVPLALPSLLSGLRVSAPLAPLGAVVGEWVGASAGLGFIMVQANARMQTATVFVAMAILAMFSLLMRHAVDRLAPRLIPWASNQ